MQSLSLAQPQQNPTDVNTLLAQGEHALSTNNLNEAYEHFKQAAEQFSSADAYYFLGRIWIEFASNDKAKSQQYNTTATTMFAAANKLGCQKADLQQKWTAAYQQARDARTQTSQTQTANQSNTPVTSTAPLPVIKPLTDDQIADYESFNVNNHRISANRLGELCVGIIGNSMTKVVYRFYPLSEGDFQVHNARLSFDQLKPIVIKSVSTEHTNPAAEADLRREAELLTQLDHPNIVTLHGSLTSTGNSIPFSIVTDYAPKGSLFSFIHNVTLLKDQASLQQFDMNQFDANRVAELSINFLYGMALGMQYLHEHHIVFPGLDSQHVVIKDDNSVSLIGLSSAYKIPQGRYDCVDHIVLRQLPRSTLFVDPQLLHTNGINIQYSYQHDVWPFGMIANELFAPESFITHFQADTSNVELAHAEKAKQIPANMPQSIAAVVACCFMPPQQRPSYDDLVQTIEATNAASIIRSS